MMMICFFLYFNKCVYCCRARVKVCDGEYYTRVRLKMLKVGNENEKTLTTSTPKNSLKFSSD